MFTAKRHSLIVKALAGNADSIDLITKGQLAGQSAEVAAQFNTLFVSSGSGVSGVKHGKRLLWPICWPAHHNWYDG